MKRIILLVVLVLVARMTTFGQTAFIRDKDGSIKKVLVQELPRVDTLCIIEQDLSTIPGTAEQQLWALENPGRSFLVEERDTLVYSQFGLIVCDYKKQIWIKSDGKTLDVYPEFIPYGKEHPSWICPVLIVVFVLSYLVGRRKTLGNGYPILILIYGCGLVFVFLLELIAIIVLLFLIFFNQMWVAGLIGIGLAIVGYLLGYYTTKKKEETAPLEAVKL